MNIFYASTRRFESPENTLTGGQIKSLANISSFYQIYQDRFGDGPDLGIGDGVAVNIVESVKHFYNLLPATMYREVPD